MTSTAIGGVSPGHYIPESSKRSIDYSRVIDRLAAWLINPSSVCADGLESPSEESIWSALRFAAGCYRRKEEMPQRIVEDGEGGITMDDWGKWQIVQYSIDKDGQIERMVFEDSRLVRRENVGLKQ